MNMDMPDVDTLKEFRAIVEQSPDGPDKVAALAKIDATLRDLQDDGVSSDVVKAEDSARDVEDTERLRRYWTHGEGAAKIVWGTPGDFDRCVAELGKYIDNPEGYCAERHHDALGIWPATHAAEERGRKSAVPNLTNRSGMVSLDLPPGLVPVVPGGVDDHHVTVVYLGSDVDDDLLDRVCERVRGLAASRHPMAAVFHGIGSFPAGEDGTPVWMGVTAPGIEDLHEALSEFNASGHPDYHPHMTLTYLQDGDEAPPEPTPASTVFPALSVHRGDQVWRFPFGGGL